MIILNNKTYASSAEIFFELFNDKLKLMVVWLLLNNPLRFKELATALAPLTNKTLTIKLRELEELHIVSREVFAEVPPRVEYSLTAHGASLRPVIAEILAWSQSYALEFGTTKEEI
ncbi:MAG: transcriptional regulator [Sulfuricurvum sp. PC08-66]|nr:MAG: transcriptional regulator [Sulfuricurvum sp. PC08-66]